ncbi:hypothetical protein [Anaerosporobacter sp.]
MQLKKYFITQLARCFQDYKKQEVLLPIGTFSSMLIANLYFPRNDMMLNEKEVEWLNKKIFSANEEMKALYDEIALTEMNETKQPDIMMKL